MDGAVIVKLVSLFFMLISSAIICYVTLKSKRIKNDPKLAGMGNAFSGGIFIAVAIMDLIPDSVEMINDSGIGFTDLSWLLILVGYVLVFVIEKMFEEPEPEHPHNPEVLANPALTAQGLHNINSEKQEIREDLLATDPLYNTRKAEMQDSVHSGPKKSSYKAYVMAVALSIHSVLEGMAIGLVSDMGSLINITLGIIIHKLPETLAVAIAILPETRRKYIIINTIFTIASPIGIALGMVMVGASLLVQGIFMSLCAGTFVYIAASEIIVEEFTTTEYRMPKFISFMVGTVLFTVVKILIDIY